MFGKRTETLVTMIDEFSESIKHLPFNLFFDNLFTSTNLLEHLSKMGYTGLVR